MARLVMQSDPGDYIGQGQSWDITYTESGPNYGWWAQASDPQGSSAQPATVSFSLGAGSSGSTTGWLNAMFSSRALGTPLAPGVYPQAQRAPFASTGFAGLDISFQHRGCNQLAGSFEVKELVLGANNVVQRFVATFEQHCEAGVPALRGSFVYDASGNVAAVPTLPPPPPEPMARLIMQSDAGDFIGLGQSWDVTYRLSGNNYYWIARATDPVGNSASPSTLQFLLGSGNESLTFTFSSRQLATALAPGAYSPAQRAAFADPGVAGLDLSFGHRACNQLAGSFVIKELVLGANNVVQRFVATFEQHCEAGTPAARGTFIYDASGNLAFAEPAPQSTEPHGVPALSPFGLALVSFAIGALGLRSSRRRRRAASH